MQTHLCLHLLNKVLVVLNILRIKGVLLSVLIVCTFSKHIYSKSRATDSSVFQPISSSDIPYETSSVVISSTSLPPITLGQPIASSSSRRLEDIPTQNAQPPVEAFSDHPQLLNRVEIQLRTIRTTRWRVINTYFLLIAGTAKSISAYKNASTPANSLDLVIGIVWGLM